MANQDSQPPVVQNKAPAPPGILPKNAQAWVIGGLAVVMAIVIAFSGSNAPPAKHPPVAVVPTDPNEGRIKEYRDRIEAGAKHLNEVKDQLEKERAAQAVGAIPPGTTSPYGPMPSTAGRTEGNPSVYGRYDYGGYGARAPEKSWVELDREKRAYLSLYSSNIALSHRPVEVPGEGGGPLSLFDRGPTKPRRVRDADDSDDADQDREASNSKGKAHEDIDQAVGSKYRIFEGTVLETVLTNRLDGDFSGPVNCMTTTNVYSHNGLHVLVPAGSRVLGEVKRVDAFGQTRLAVVFHRLIMPDGYTTSLDKFRGLDQIGETGLSDHVNHHYLQVFGVSIAIGAIAGLSQASTNSGTAISAADAYRQGVATSLSQSSLRILDRYLNVLPTVTIREGQRVKIYLADDLLLPAYENHRMPNDL